NRRRDPEELLGGEAEPHVVDHRARVVQAVRVRDRLVPLAALAFLLEATVQVSDLDLGIEDALAVELEVDLDGAVGRRVRRRHRLCVEIVGDRGLIASVHSAAARGLGPARAAPVKGRAAAPAAAASPSGSPSAAGGPETLRRERYDGGPDGPRNGSRTYPRSR